MCSPDSRLTIEARTRERRDDRKSTLLRNSIAWNQVKGELTVGEHWFDIRTGVPQGNGPAFIASSPEFDETDLRQVKGWEPVLRQLRPLAVRHDAWGEVRIKEFVFAADVRLRLELHRASWGKLRLRMAAGPWVGRLPARGGPLWTSFERTAQPRSETRLDQRCGVSCGSARRTVCDRRRRLCFVC